MRTILAAVAAGLAASSSWAQPVGEREEIVALASDETEIHGTYVQPFEAESQVPLAVLLPMYGHDRASWEPIIDPLVRAGFAVAAIDLRGHGRSIRRGSETLSYESARSGGENLFTEAWMDVDAAVAWVERNHGGMVDTNRIGLIGASVGCSVALNWSTRDARARTLVLLSPGTDYLGTDSVGDIAATRAERIVMISPEPEAHRPRALEEAARSAGNSVPITVTIEPGHEEHGTDMFGAVPGLEERILGAVRPLI